MDPTTRFTDLVAGPEDTLALDELGLVVAEHAHPHLDVAANLAHFDDLAGQVEEATLDGLRRLLFGGLGFTGNDVDYYDPSNSYLDDVLRRRTGIPVSLAVVMLEVGRRVGISLSGIGMPGHFLVGDDSQPGMFVDPFARGALLDGAGARRRFHALHGDAAVFEDAFLHAVGRRSILDRQLANLEAIATARGETFDLIWVLRLRASIPGSGSAVDRRLAAALGAGGQVLEAAMVLDRLAASAEDEATATGAALAARAMRARLN